jgi:hypothetical protein
MAAMSANARIKIAIAGLEGEIPEVGFVIETLKEISFSELDGTAGRIHAEMDRSLA